LTDGNWNITLNGVMKRFFTDFHVQSYLAAAILAVERNNIFLREKVKREQCGKECAKEMRWLLEVEGGRKLRDLCSREQPQGRDRRALP
jgi:hypothetical protein